jgi:diacylglycerol kinase family enzyme
MSYQNNLLHIVVLKNSGSFEMLDEMINVKNGKSIHTGNDSVSYAKERKVIRVIMAGEPGKQYIYCPQ